MSIWYWTTTEDFGPSAQILAADVPENALSLNVGQACPVCTGAVPVMWIDFKRRTYHCEASEHPLAGPILRVSTDRRSLEVIDPDGRVLAVHMGQEPKT